MKSFMNYGGDGDNAVIMKENLVIHPLFWHLKNSVEQVDEVPIAKREEMTSRKFYQEYLTMSLPVLVEDGCLNWDAVDKW